MQEPSIDRVDDFVKKIGTKHVAATSVFALSFMWFLYFLSFLLPVSDALPLILFTSWSFGVIASFCYFVYRF